MAVTTAPNVEAQPAMVHGPGCTKPNVVKLCACGANVSCLNCHYGRGQHPCKCSPKLAPLQSHL